MMILLLLAGLVLLVVGGEFLVRGSVRAARSLGVSPLIIGLTLVGFGTSSPELVTSIQAARIGQPGIAVGNVVGSNIANLFLVLGASAIFTPILVPRGALSRDGVIVLVTAFLFALVAWFHVLDRVVGCVFLVLLVTYLIYAYRQERTRPEEHTAALDRSEARDVAIPHPREAPSSTKTLGLAKPLAIAVAGLACVVLGGTLFVDGAVQLAKRLGVSEATIGLTVVAVGTSLPELVTSVVAAYRKHGDLALGNVLGSNIYNILMIGGVTGIVSPLAIPDRIASIDNSVMLGASALVLVFAYTGLRIGRLEAGILLAAYAGYVFVTWS